VALTFDAEHPDRPHHGDTQTATIGALARDRVRATFFIQGRWAEAYPDLARRVASDGHLVGSHSFYHARMPLLRPGAFDVDVRSAERAITAAIGRTPRPWFRMPFGAGADQPRLIQRLQTLGYRHVGWHVTAREWQRRRSTHGAVEAVVDGVATHGDGAIVLLHTWPDPVANGLPEIVARLRTLGAEFVPVDELDLKPGLAPVGPHADSVLHSI
jgi:peptidoglycan/xylan/chitin deacetylase (PgdA/CDA1 family)